MSATIYTELANNWQEMANRLRLYDTVGFLKQAAVQVTWRELLALGLTVFMANIIYNNYFHALSRFPGPFWARTTLVRYKKILTHFWIPYIF